MLNDKKKQHSVSMRPSEWACLARAAQALARPRGPTSTGHVVSTSRFVVDAALEAAHRLLPEGSEADAAQQPLFPEEESP